MLWNQRDAAARLPCRAGRSPRRPSMPCPTCQQCWLAAVCLWRATAGVALLATVWCPFTVCPVFCGHRGCELWTRRLGADITCHCPQVGLGLRGVSSLRSHGSCSFRPLFRKPPYATHNMEDPQDGQGEPPRRGVWEGHFRVGCSAWVAGWTAGHSSWRGSIEAGDNSRPRAPCRAACLPA
jgi:hypothetical protein